MPVADNIPGGEMPRFRELWKHIGPKMPKKGRGKAKTLDPLSIPVELQTALEALYGHYAKTFDLWQKGGIKVPPCFIVVCNNTSTSKLVYDYISGFQRENEDGSTTLENGRLALFRNFDEHGNPLARPRTLLIDSEQLESGDALDDNFRTMAADEIERFRREIIERTGDRRQAENLTDQDLLREVMNTVGKYGRLGDSIRCVVSVSMLTEGWDARTVTHVLGVRAFGTQLSMRAGHRPGPAPPVLRPQRREPVQRRIRRCPGHPLRFHRQTGGCPSAAAPRDHSGQGRSSRPRSPRNPLSPCGRLSGRTAGRTAHRRVQ